MLAPSIAFTGVLVVSAIFQMRGMRVRGGRSREWADFGLVALAQWSVCTLSARWIADHAIRAGVGEIFAIAFGVAAVAGVALKGQFESSRHSDVGKASMDSANDRKNLRRAA